MAIIVLDGRRRLLKNFSHFKAKFLPIDQAIRDVKKLISIKNKINGKFVWRGKIIPLIPNLNGVDWAKGSSTGKFKKI